jgi:hypothetical protein
MEKPILMSKKSAVSRFGRRGFDGAPRQYRDQMRPIFGAAVQIAI